MRGCGCGGGLHPDRLVWRWALSFSNRICLGSPSLFWELEILEQLLIVLVYLLCLVYVDLVLLFLEQVVPLEQVLLLLLFLL